MIRIHFIFVCWCRLNTFMFRTVFFWHISPVEWHWMHCFENFSVRMKLLVGAFSCLRQLLVWVIFQWSSYFAFGAFFLSGASSALNQITILFFLRWLFPYIIFQSYISRGLQQIFIVCDINKFSEVNNRDVKSKGFYILSILCLSLNSSHVQ